MWSVSAIAYSAFYQHRVPTGQTLITQLIAFYQHAVPTGQFSTILPLAFELVLLRFAHPDLCSKKTVILDSYCLATPEHFHWGKTHSFVPSCYSGFHHEPHSDTSIPSSWAAIALASSAT
jgi:hypothetical protein